MNNVIHHGRCQKGSGDQAARSIGPLSSNHRASSCYQRFDSVRLRSLTRLPLCVLPKRLETRSNSKVTDSKTIDRDSSWKKAFLRHVCNERDAINARSPDLADHEITIAQKAFVILMKNGDTFRGAFAIYVDEILGLKTGTGKDMKQIIQDAVQVGAALLEGISQP